MKAINAKGAGDWSRGDIDKLADIASANGAKGMAWIAYTTDGKEKSPIIKFLGDEVHAKIKEAMNVEPGDLVLFAADTFDDRERRAFCPAPAHGRGPEHSARWPSSCCGSSISPCSSTMRTTKKYAAEHHPFTHDSEVRLG